MSIPDIEITGQTSTDITRYFSTVWTVYLIPMDFLHLFTFASLKKKKDIYYPEFRKKHRRKELKRNTVNLLHEISLLHCWKDLFCAQIYQLSH